VEVLKHLRTIKKNIDFCHRDIASFQPDVLVLIDYPGFNLRIAQWAKKQGFKIVYYISPQVWAWKETRVKAIKRDVDKMIVILPFEVDFYRKWNLEVDYVGHPLIEVIGAEKAAKPLHSYGGKPIIAMLPGSRAQEIKMKLPVMAGIIDRFPDYHFIIAQAPSLPDILYTEIIGQRNVTLVKGQTYNLLKQAVAAVVTSGTATLETALFGVPQIVCYKGNAVSFWLARKLVKVKYISLVNLILDKLVVKELIQDDLTEENVATEMKSILEDQEHRNYILRNYEELWQKLGSKPASDNAAKIIFSVAGS